MRLCPVDASVFGGAQARRSVFRTGRVASVPKRVSPTRAGVVGDVVRDPLTTTDQEWSNDRLSFQGHSVSRQRAPKNAPPIVILGGFGNNSLDYTAPFGDPSVSLASALTSRGWDVEVVELERKDWAKILRAVFSKGFWDTRKGTTEPGYTWYLEKIDAAVVKAVARHANAGNGETCQVDIVAHSAGGWLARAYVGGALNEIDYESKRFRYFAKEPQRCENFPKVTTPHPSVRTLVTLGAPHHVAPASKNATDATRGALEWVDKKWPGAYFKEINYVCVAGRTVRGVKNTKETKETLPGYAGASYAQVCGEADGVVGDAVVPSEYATLEGALNVSVEGVFHSMSKVGTYAEDSNEAWYGSDEVVDLWLKELT